MSLTVEVPFLTRGNRQYLTGMQIAQMPWLRDFVEKFENCFEYDDLREIVWFNPPDHQ